jgi:tetratricopeptide (TPR) repeat protein
MRKLGCLGVGLALAALFPPADPTLSRGGPAPSKSTVQEAGGTTEARAPGLETREARTADVGRGRTEGERLYLAGRFAEAYEAFRRKAEEDGPTPPLDYNTGNALYRLGRYDAAGRSFGAALSGSTALRQKGHYNTGNALFKSAETEPDRGEVLRGSVRAYEEALLLDPSDGAAKWNLELALRELEKEAQRQSGGGGGGGGAARAREEDEKPESESSPGGGGAPEDPSQAAESDRTRGDPSAGAPESEGALTEAEAKQLLEAIQGEESDALESRTAEPPRRQSGQRDW